jgi:hypothetical protein
MSLVGLLIMGNASYFSIGCSKPDIVISCCGTLGKKFLFINIRLYFNIFIPDLIIAGMLFDKVVLRK